MRHNETKTQTDAENEMRETMGLPKIQPRTRNGFSLMNDDQVSVTDTIRRATQNDDWKNNLR